MKKSFFKLIAFVLILVIAATNLTFFASAEVEINPNDYISDKNQVASILRTAMENRQTGVTVLYTDTVRYDDSNFLDLLDEFEHLAFVETSSATQGDYLYYNLESFGVGNASAAMLEDGKYYYKIPFVFEFRTTKQQEEAVTDKVNEIIANFGFNSQTTTEQKIKAIYDYITQNVTYDNENLNNEGYTLKYTAYAALINKTSVCQGYALLFYRIAKACGIDTRIIKGKSYNQNHAWNIVKLGLKYYNLDTTWDAGESNYSYYLKGSDDFTNHISDQEFNTQSFKQKYPVSKVDYESNLKNGWKYENNKWYYYDNGQAHTGWLNLGGIWYYLKSDGVMATGWQMVNGTWYYLQNSGAMATGWLKLGNTWYYLKNSGAMATGWLRVGNTWYYLENSGAMKTGWLNLGGTWYYLNNGGAMQTGWLKLGNYWYYLNSGGAMQTGWLKLGNYWYYLYNSGVMATNISISGGYIDNYGIWRA